MPNYPKKDLRDVIPEASDEAIKIIGLMLRYNSDYRPNADELMKEPYFEDIHDQYLEFEKRMKIGSRYTQNGRKPKTIQEGTFESLKITENGIRIMTMQTGE